MTTPEEALDKVRKLLALTRSDNRHEAELAAEMAQRIMARYHLDEALLHEADAPEQDEAATGELRREYVFQHGRDREPGWWWRIVQACCTENRVRAWSGWRGYSGQGLKADLEASRFLIDHFVRVVDHLSEKAQGREWSGRAGGASWRLGCATGIAEALHAARKLAEREARERAADPMKALEQDYREAQASGNLDKILELDGAARDIPIEPSYALAKVDAAIVRVEADRETLLARTREAVKDLKLRTGHAPRISDGGAFGRGVKAGRAVDVKPAEGRLM